MTKETQTFIKTNKETQIRDVQELRVPGTGTGTGGNRRFRNWNWVVEEADQTRVQGGAAAALGGGEADGGDGFRWQKVGALLRLSMEFFCEEEGEKGGVKSEKGQQRHFSDKCAVFMNINDHQRFGPGPKP
ncbi:hypothetical protein LXL04_002055 [Taraxacum kok-saghyz]